MKKWTIVAMLMAVLLVFSALPAAAVGPCDVTVLGTDAAGSIQTAVDTVTDVNSDGERVVCLDGTFSNEATVAIGTSGITLTSASPGILDGGSGPAFRLADGVSNVTIEGLEIRNRTGGRGGGIEAWDMSTSNITIRSNNIHDNTYNAVLVGSEGGYIHKKWKVQDNTIDEHGFAGIELTNCENCMIMGNNVADSGFAGIVVQARNTAGIGSVAIGTVKVRDNTVDNAGFSGVYVLSYTGPTGPPFQPAVNGVVLTNVTVNNNTMIDTGNAGVIFWAYNGGAMADNAKINDNAITCASTGPASGKGVRVLQAGGDGTGTVTNVKVMSNSFSGCTLDVEDTGTGTKIRP